MNITPDINFIRHRPLITIRIAPTKRIRECLHQMAVGISGAALVSSLAGYGALLLGRDIPIALGLGAAGSVGLAINTKLKEL